MTQRLIKLIVGLSVLGGCGGEQEIIDPRRTVEILDSGAKLPDCAGTSNSLYYDTDLALFHQCQGGQMRVVNDVYDALEMNDAFQCNGYFEAGSISGSRINYSYTVWKLGDNRSLITCSLSLMNDTVIGGNAKLIDQNSKDYDLSACAIKADVSGADDSGNFSFSFDPGSRYSNLPFRSVKYTDEGVTTVRQISDGACFMP